MIQPKELTIKTQAGDEKTFFLSKFPATVGREIFCKYPLSGLPKLGDYAVNEETMIKCLSYVQAITPAGQPIALSSRALIDNHVPDWETLVKLEYAMLEYNGSFFENGKVSGFLDMLTAKVPELTSKILTVLSERSSAQSKQRSTN